VAVVAVRYDLTFSIDYKDSQVSTATAIDPPQLQPLDQQPRQAHPARGRAHAGAFN
jgi:hypothetical protein